MVNADNSNKKIILDTLSNADAPVSGEKLAEATGVSRTAVWKNISVLKELGYLIETTRKGYRLIEATDRPIPLEMDSSIIEYHNELDSTMHKASRLIASGCPDGTVVIAGTQTAGKSLNGGQWKSPEGGLYLTRIRMRPLPTLYAGLYIVSMAAAVIDMLDKNYYVKAGLNWPGGLDFEGRKLGGLLVENRVVNDMIISSAAGLGLNINNSGVIPSGAASLSELIGRPASIKKITADLLEALEKHDREFPQIDVNKLYNNHIKQAGMRCRVLNTTGRKFSGRIIKLHESGALVLTSDDNRIEYIFSGDKIEYE